MKKLAFTVAVAFIATSIFAQKGSMYIGGGLGFMEDYWKVAPEAGIWVTDDLQLGLVLTIENVVDETNFAPHLYLRKWFTVTEKFSLYAGINGRLNSNPGFEADGDAVFDAFLDGGFAYAVAPRWGIVGRVGSLGYIDEEFKFDFNMSPQSLFNVGIYWTFLEGSN